MDHVLLLLLLLEVNPLELPFSASPSKEIRSEQETTVKCETCPMLAQSHWQQFTQIFLLAHYVIQEDKLVRALKMI